MANLMGTHTTPLRCTGVYVSVVSAQLTAGCVCSAGVSLEASLAQLHIGYALVADHRTIYDNHLDGLSVWGSKIAKGADYIVLSRCVACIWT